MLFDIYCRVVDNYGDAGVCLRLARLLRELGHQVQLFCDDLKVLRTIARPDDDSENLRFLPFEAHTGTKADAVIEAFLCHLPEERAAEIKADNTLVICLDYLSAEKWVEDFHTLSSPGSFAHCYYFYPGFTKKTGGLLLEPRFKKLAAQPHQYCKDGVREATLFCYHNEALSELFSLLKSSKRPTHFTLFAGLPLENLNMLLGTRLQTGDSYREGCLSFTVSPMVSQSAYDALLCASDLNLVRGEDSIVRAMYCGRPFLWQIYPQEEDTHIVKLKAFMDLFFEVSKAGPESREQLWQLMLCYNQRAARPELDFDSFELRWRELCAALQRYLFTLPNLAQSLADFVAQKQAENSREKGL